MRPPCQTGVFIALALGCAFTVAQAQQTPRLPLRTLTTAREAHDLSLEEATRAYPVHLRAVVTYYDPYIDSRHAAIFVHDSSGSIFISVPLRPILPLRAGTIVDVVGVSGTGDYAPILARAQLRVIGESQVPTNAPRATVAQMISGSLDGQWVEVEGLVHAVHLTQWNVTLEIATAGGLLSATTRRESGKDYDSLVDSLIRLHGNNAPEFNRKRQMVGVRLFFPSLEEVKVVQAAPGDPFATPPLSIPQLLQFSPRLEIPRRVHMQGRVTLQWPGRTLCIQQAGNGLCMRTAQSTPANVGQLVDVIGFPAISEYKATLDNAIFRVAGDAAPPQAKPVLPDQAFQGDHDGELVQIDGELIGQDRAASDPTLMIRSGKFLFLAVLPRDSTPAGSFPWTDGSQLRLTGICSVQFDPETTNLGAGEVRPGLVRILLRSTGDIEVLQAPSWWTQAHALAVLAVLCTLVFAAFAWIIVLRLRVRHQTQALRSSEERLRHMSEHDALTNLPNRILLADRLNMALKRAEKSQAGLGLLMVDVDRFKEVNDCLGHIAGDRVLCELADRLTAPVRMTDTVARIGGDEFIVLLPDLRAPAEALTIAAKIVSAGSSPIDIGTEHIPVTVSVGVCTYPEGGMDAEELLRNADDAMYRVKAQGGNGAQVYSRAGNRVH